MIKYQLVTLNQILYNLIWNKRFLSTKNFKEFYKIKKVNLIHMWMCSKIGRLLTCFIASCLIYFSLACIYNFSTNKVISENAENKDKSLHFFIDR